ncbi:general secretion pathway protein GspB [Oceanobacter sp. 5_MG-2023]|uniref:general secretion pathway protein GspB n=1 Tax=Oceanobacter sp. 5_MG-2023 TaxID=3062645 RepID=UPI0026E3E0F0|nr:general secretion pathway protein GspB [Oceanobacter sp. 5_MG-2023]MDO6681190.1 general secretion pathway protein GspB [Oceanobacter sp. 5_MG-2023]
MSYILDALKKSQQQRADSIDDAMLAPLLVTPEATPVVEARLPLSLVLIVLLAVVGAFALYFMGAEPVPAPGMEPVVAEINVKENVEESVAVPATAEATGSVSEPSVVAAINNETPLAVPPVESAQQLRPEVIRATDFVPAKARETAETTTVSVTPQPPPVVVEAATPPEKASLQSAAPESTQVSTQANTPEPPAVAAADSSALERRHLPPLSSLRKVPDLVITGHIYSQDGSTRTVSMNGRQWYEGDMIVPGVFLQSITSSGLVLDVDGYPFPINRNSGWQSIGE